MATPPDETLNVKAGICICNVEGIICAKLSARILQLSIHHDQNRDTDLSTQKNSIDITSA